MGIVIPIIRTELWEWEGGWESSNEQNILLASASKQNLRIASE